MSAARKIIRPENLFDPSFHSYSHGVKVGNLLFISGQMAFVKEKRTGKRRLVGRGDIEAQSRQVFRNIETILAESGASLKHVVSMTAYLKDIRNLEKFCRVRGEFFKRDPPTSTAVQVSAFADTGGLVEVNAIAVLS